MNLTDAALILLVESAGEPAVARLAQSAFDQLAQDARVDHQTLSDLIGEASGKGVLRAIHRKYSPTAYESILEPIFREIDRQRPVPPPRPRAAAEDDPLTAATWPL